MSAWMLMAMVCAVGALEPSAGAEANKVGDFEAISKPSEDRTLSCPRPGLIAKVLVKEGDTVKAGDSVVQQDDREEQAKLAADKSKAEDSTRVEAQKKIRDQSQVDYKRYQEAHKRGGATNLELDKARIDVEVADAQVKMAEKEQEQARLNYEQTRVLVEKMRLISPINGIVQSTMVNAGESVELNTKVIRIVNLNPLWVEANIPQTTARNLKLGDPSDVRYPGDVKGSGKVVFIAPVGDSASETILVRVEIANPELRHAGEQVKIRFANTTE